MKANRLFFIKIMLLFFLFAGCRNDKFAPEKVNTEKQSERTKSAFEQESNKTWDYSVKLGMGKWNQLKTEEERIAALQVPDEVLAKLTSEEIVDLCISFPLFGYYTAFNTPQTGFSIMHSRFNIFEHLMNRSDVGKHLIDAYKDADMKGFRTLPFSNEFWTIKLHYLELVLSQTDVLRKLTPEEILELIQEARKKFSEKTVDPAFSSLYGILFPVRMMANILDMEGLIDNNMRTANKSLQTGFLEDVSLLDEIIDMTDVYINSKK